MPKYELAALPFDSKAFSSLVRNTEAAVRKATHSLRGEIVVDLRNIVQTWEHAVNFRTRTESSGGNLVLFITTTDKIFGYVNNGTRPRVIKAKNKPNLSVRLGFHPKTIPGRLQSSAGGYDGPVRFTPIVRNYPGITARDFTGTIATKYGYRMYTLMLDAIRQSVT